MTAEEIQKALKTLKGWRHAGRMIVKRYEFKAYLDGIRFVTRVARLAEKQNHHPDIAIGWRWATLALMTHDEEGLTERDFKLARAIDGL